MDKQTLIEKIKKMATARTCRPELKRSVQKYLISLGKPGEKLAAQNLIAEIEENITPIDELVTFSRSAQAIQILGKEGAKKLLAHVAKLTASGAKFCDCPACKPATEILQYKEIILEAKQPQPNETSTDKKTLHKKLREIEASPSCHPSLRVMIQKYFDALGTSNEKIVAENLITELENDVELVDVLVIFAHSNRAIEMLGAERAKIFAANADALKASGAKYCNCLACTLGLEVLENKEILLGK